MKKHIAERPILAVTVLVIVAATMLAGSRFLLAEHFVFPSTNEENRASGTPHVDLLDAGYEEVTLKFNNPTETVVQFEYRIDGKVLEPDGSHPTVTEDDIYPGVCVDGRDIDVCDNGEPLVRTFNSSEKIEVRLALGGDSAWYFDWTTFEPITDPTTREECFDGAFEIYGFKNQGACVQFVQNGRDTR